MSIDLLLGVNTNDLVIEDGDLQLTNSQPTFLRQRMAITFNTYTREWFWNQEFGAINTDIIFNKSTGKPEIDSWFISIINSFPEVLEILSFESTANYQTRSYTLVFRVRTEEGEVSIFVRAGRPDLEITYPTPTELPVDFDDCGVSIADANELYELIHIDLPLDIPWG